MDSGESRTRQRNKTKGIDDRNDISEQKTQKAETNIIKNDNKRNTINSAHER